MLPLSRLYKSGRQDLNLRPSDPQSDERKPEVIDVKGLMAFVLFGSCAGSEVFPKPMDTGTARQARDLRPSFPAFVMFHLSKRKT
ncbi:MAG: hypothetical protein ACRCUY_04130 [Thermoguttaceae bacterium]